MEPRRTRPAYSGRRERREPPPFRLKEKRRFSYCHPRRNPNTAAQVPLSRLRNADLRRDLRRFQEPNPLGLFFCTVQQERNHESVLANERVYLKADFDCLAVETIKALLIWAGATPCFAANRVLSLCHSPGFRIGNDWRNDRDRFGANRAESVEIPALGGTGFAHFSLSSNVLQERVTI
jgi:hypothetical protein